MLTRRLLILRHVFGLGVDVEGSVDDDTRPLARAATKDLRLDRDLSRPQSWRALLGSAAAG